MKRVAFKFDERSIMPLHGVVCNVREPARAVPVFTSIEQELTHILREAEASARLLRLDDVGRWNFLDALRRRVEVLRDEAWIEPGKGRR